MLQRELLSHQWKAFLRNPMFARNLGIRIFMFFMFGLLALEMLIFGFVLDKALLEIGTYTLAIDVFNSILVYVLLVDFMIKFFFKTNQSMQIVPYLTLPVKRNKLFDFLLRKEFTSFWNWYWLFLVVPFAFKAVTPYFGLGAVFLYIIFFYLLCVGVSLFLNLVNILLDKSKWFYLIPAAIIVFPFLFSFGLNLSIGNWTQKLGELILNCNLIAWIVFLALIALLWVINRGRMREQVYRELQGEKVDKFMSFAGLSFLDNFGEIGNLIGLDIKMISRTKRLRQQFMVIFFILIYYVFILYAMPAAITSSFFMMLFFPMFMIGFVGLVMGQYVFTSESSFFDGLMTRNISLFNMLKGKYILYSSISLILTLLIMIPVFQGKLNFFLVISVFFYVIGPIYFFIFQNAVYNKSYFDLFEGGAFNWKGTSSNMMVITMMTMFLPLLIVVIIKSIFGYNAACGFMLATGIGLTLTCNYWLRWIYNRFWKRRYKNMEGFRAN